MKPEPYCINLKFKDVSVSDKMHHAHLYLEKNEIYIIINIENSDSSIVTQFMMRKNSLSFFDENFEIINSEVELILDKSRIHLIKSTSHENKPGFTIYLTSICVVKPNTYKEDIGIGKAILNKNGLTIVNSFYSFFTNWNHKNKFEISRMNTMKDYYDFLDLKYRPELDFNGYDKRGSKKFTVTKIPTINFKYKSSTYEDCKEHIDSICKILSFFYGIRVEYYRLTYRTSDHIYFYTNHEKRNDNFVSKHSLINRFLDKSYSIEKFLKTNWQTNYIEKKSKIDKAVDNLLHSREVESSSKYLLLFNIIEIFNINQNVERFELNDSKEESIKKAQRLFEETLANKEDLELFREKWEGTINKVFIKPLKSPLEETLKLNKINVEEFGFSFKELKSVRDKLTHGSTNSISDEKLKSYIGVIRRICICLILFQLGFDGEIKNGI